MSKQKDTPVEPTDAEIAAQEAEINQLTESAKPQGMWTISKEEFADALGQGIARALAEHQPKKKSFGQYVREMAKKFPKKRLLRPAMLNGAPVQDFVLSNPEIDYLNKITRSGHYIQRKVQVIVRNEGLDFAEQSIEIRYSDKSIDQRFENKGLWRNFEDLLRQVVAEQEVAIENEKLRMEGFRARA